MTPRELIGTVERPDGTALVSGRLIIEIIEPGPAGVVGTSMYRVVNGAIKHLTSDLEADNPPTVASPANVRVSLVAAGSDIIEPFAAGIPEAASALDWATWYEGEHEPVEVVLSAAEQIATHNEDPDAHGALLPITIGDVTDLQTELDSKATTADITAAINALIDGAPGALDTLNELAAALNDDDSFAATVTTALADRYTKEEVDDLLSGVGGGGGSGDVVGPADSADDEVVAFSGTTGKLLKRAGKTVAQLLDRAQHTGTQLAATISDFGTAVAAAIASTIATITAALTDHESRVAYLEGNGPSAYEDEYYRVEAALTEPRIMRTAHGFEKYTVPDDETHYHVSSWNCRYDGDEYIARFEHREFMHPVPMRGVAIHGHQKDSIQQWLDPTGVTYPLGSRREYFRKLQIIAARQTRYKRRIGGSVISSESLLPGPHDSYLVMAGAFDVAWGTGLPELGDRAGNDETAVLDAAYLADHNFQHQEIRFTRETRAALSLNNFPKISGGIGFNWGLAYGQPNGPSHIPQNWLVFVNVPLDFHGVDYDLITAPNGWVAGQSVSTVNDTQTLPADVIVTDPDTGGVIVHPDNEWLKVTAGATDYATGWRWTPTYTPTTGEAWMCEYYQPEGTHKAVLGLFRNASIAKADAVYAIEIDGTTLKVLHNPGSGQTSRTFAAFSLVAGEIYRFKITFAASGAAYFEMQSTWDPGDRLTHPMGSRDWWDLLEGTAPATGTGITGLQMGESVGASGTYHLTSWPRIIEAHDDATAAPGYLLHETFEGMPYQVPYSSPNTLIHTRQPNRQQVGTTKWAASPTNSVIAVYGEAHNLSGIDLFRYDIGVADVDFTFKVLLTAGAGWAYHRFNWNESANRGWRFAINDATGFLILHDYDGGGGGIGTEHYVGVQGATSSPWDTPLGPGEVTVRIWCLDDQIKTWINGTLCHNLTIATRPWKAQTEIGVSTYDDAGASRVRLVKVGRAP